MAAPSTCECARPKKWPASWVMIDWRSYEPAGVGRTTEIEYCAELISMSASKIVPVLTIVTYGVTTGTIFDGDRVLRRVDLHVGVEDRPRRHAVRHDRERDRRRRIGADELPVAEGDHVV